MRSWPTHSSGLNTQLSMKMNIYQVHGTVETLSLLLEVTSLATTGELSARMRYVGETPFAPVDEDETLANYPAIIRDYSQLGSVRLSTFNQTDVRVDKKWNFERWTFNVFLEIQNIFGQDIPNEPTYGLDRDEDGTIILPETLIQIDGADNSSVLPSIGIVIDF